MRTVLVTLTVARSQRVRRTILVFALALPLGLMSAGKAAPAVPQVDQSNLPEWGGGWTHVNPTGEGRATMWQTFTSGCPNLTAVEIDILTIGPGRGDDVLTVEIAKDGVVLASAQCVVQDGFDGLLRFEFPEAMPLIPEQVYELRVRDTGKTRFGWKYGLNTYERGSRYVFAQPRPGTDWFFRTYAEIPPVAAKYSGGTGEPNDPYQIATAADLIALGETPEDYDKHFILTADIDLDPNLPGGRVFDKAIIARDVYYTEEGVLAGPFFTGVFDGAGHSISHLSMAGQQDLGLFGYSGPSAQILNLRLEAVDINLNGDFGSVGSLVACNSGSIAGCASMGTVRGGWDVGGLVGRNEEGKITASHSSATVTGDGHVGGLVGDNYKGSIAGCSSTGTVKGGDKIGGLVGTNEEGSKITASYSSATVSGDVRVGGLLGENSEGEVYEYENQVDQCYSTGAVSGTWSVGGLVGGNYDSIMDCYSTSAVTGEEMVGGLVGTNGEQGGIARSYSTGRVTASRRAGGLVGGADEDAANERCFWDIETSGQTTSAGGTGKTTAEMQTAATFIAAGWDFVGETANGTEDIWWIDEGKDYPRLSWELLANDAQ